jgi:mannose-6-phosphate isomerase-like protein (cupin superfamily)
MTTPTYKSHLVAADAKPIQLPWCHVEEFVTPENAGSEDLYLCRATFPPGEAHLFHFHPGREEIIYVLQGQAEQWVGDTKRLLGPGEMALIPAGVPHMTFNPGPEPLQFLAVLNNIRGEQPICVDCFRESPWVELFAPIEYPTV